MSSNIESVVAGANTPNVDPVELSDEDNVQLNEEANDMVDEILDNEGEGSKRKSSSGAWSHFTTVEVQEDGKMVKKHECMHCKKKYAPQSSRTTTHLLHSLYVKYSTAFHMARSSKNNMTSTSFGAPDVRDRLEDDFYAFLKSRPVENSQKSEVEVYLEEPNYIVLENKEFDVLSWWSQNSSKFPVLSKMARNIFSILITTVASESAFSAGGRILDDYRSSLTKDMVELLVCGGDWIKSTSKTTIQTLQQLAMEEENLEVPIPTSDDAFN